MCKKWRCFVASLLPFHRWEAGTQRPSVSNMVVLMKLTGDVDLPRKFTKWADELREILVGEPAA